MLCQFSFFKYEALNESTMANMRLSKCGLDMITLHGYTSDMWEKDVVIALGERGSKSKNVETYMAQFASKSYAQFHIHGGTLANFLEKQSWSFKVHKPGNFRAVIALVENWTFLT